MLSKLIPLLVAPALLGAQQQVQAVAAMGDTSFHPISMAEAVRLAKENNVANISGNNSIRLANNAVRAAKAQLYPTLNATAGQNKSAGQRVGPQNNIIDYNPVWSYQTGLNANMTLFDGGKAFADIKTQKANVAAAQAQEVNTQAGVELQVKLAYNSILAAKESEGAAQAQIDAAKAQLETSIEKVKAGAANVSDSLRSVVQLGNAQLALLTAQNQYRVSTANLTRLVGTNYFVTADPADTVAHPITPIDSTAVAQLALEGPQIRALQAQLTSNTAAERSAKAAYLPTLTMGLNYSGSGTGAYGLNNSPFPYSRGVNFSLNYPLFNRFTRENNIATAQISYEDTQAQLRDAQLAAQQNIVTDFATLRNAEETMRVQQINVEASQEDLRVQQQRYALGASVLLDVLNSQVELVTARQALIQARLNYRNARAQIEAAIGRDLP